MVVARLAVAYLLVACHQLPPSRAPGAGEQSEITHGAFLAQDDARPSYSRADLERALAAEHAAIASAEARDLDAAAIADLAVRRRFAASLEQCRDTGLRCPPRIDDPRWSYDVEGSADPKLDTELRFDVDDWRKVAAELHGRACACRTLSCVDSMMVAIGALETRPMPDVQDDEAASDSITHARECLFRLRGEKRD